MDWLTLIISIIFSALVTIPFNAMLSIRKPLLAFLIPTMLFLLSLVLWILAMTLDLGMENLALMIFSIYCLIGGLGSTGSAFFVLSIRKKAYR